MTAMNNGEKPSHKDQPDRSVHIGQAENVQIVSGDEATVNTVFSGQQVVTTVQDFSAALKKLNGILALAEIDSVRRTEIEKAVAEAEAEAVKEKPEKGRIAQALEKAMSLAKFANNAKELFVLASPVVLKAAEWLGEAGSRLIGLLK